MKKDIKKVLGSFEAAAKSVGRDPLVLPGTEELAESDAADVVSGFKLGVISEAAWKHAGIEIDWDNWKQGKYYPWWDMRTGSGVGLRFNDFGCDRERSCVGSRRVFPSREIAEYVAKQHFQLYVDTLVVKKK